MHTTTGTTELRNVTAFELVSNFIRNGHVLNLTPSENLVMISLLNCYNVEKRFVFPSQALLSKQTALSLPTIKRAIKSLVNKQLLVKMRTQFGNTYGLTGRLFDVCQVSSRTLQKYHNDTCMIKKQINKKINHHKNMTLNVRLPDDDFNLIKPGSPSKIKIEDVPSIIKGNKNIKNPCGYWASLTVEERNFQLKKQEEEETARILKLENARQLKELKEREEAERREAEQAPRPNEFNFEQAFNHLKHIASLSFAHKALQSPMCRELMSKHNITIDMLYNN